ARLHPRRQHRKVAQRSDRRCDSGLPRELRCGVRRCRLRHGQRQLAQHAEPARVAAARIARRVVIVTAAKKRGAEQTRFAQTAEDAWEKLCAGASLIQLYTGFIYEGPGLARSINEGLVEILKREGLSNLDDAVGCAVR